MPSFKVLGPLQGLMHIRETITETVGLCVGRDSIAGAGKDASSNELDRLTEASL